MSIVQSFLLALKGLATSKMRALLTMLGIIIGVAAVIIIISLGDGMQTMISEEFSRLGTNLLQVSIVGRGTSRSVSADEMYALKGEYPEYILAVSPSVSVNTSIKYGSETYSSSITGVGEDYPIVKALELSEGRFLQYLDITRLQKVCVIGSYVNQNTFNGDGLGQVLRLGGNNFTVVGVLAEKAEGTEYGDDNAIYIPYTTATRLNGSTRISSYLFTAVNEDVTSQAKSVIERRLLRAFGNEDAYYVISMTEMLSMMGNITGMVMTVLVAIAAISLLVGGIGIMNIMLVSVTERTREIGIRKSLGAKGRDIRGQFIIEAGTTSAIGGILGILLGVTLAGLAGNLLGLKATPSLNAILLSAGVSIAVGIVFGYLPANKAAKLNPIDALRYD